MYQALRRCCQALGNWIFSRPRLQDIVRAYNEEEGGAFTLRLSTTSLSVFKNIGLHMGRLSFLDVLFLETDSDADKDRARATYLALYVAMVIATESWSAWRDSRSHVDYPLDMPEGPVRPRPAEIHGLAKISPASLFTFFHGTIISSRSVQLLAIVRGAFYFVTYLSSSGRREVGPLAASIIAVPLFSFFNLLRDVVHWRRDPIYGDYPQLPPGLMTTSRGIYYLTLPLSAIAGTLFYLIDPLMIAGKGFVNLTGIDEKDRETFGGADALLVVATLSAAAAVAYHKGVVARHKSPRIIASHVRITATFQRRQQTMGPWRAAGQVLTDHWQAVDGWALWHAAAQGVLKGINVKYLLSVLGAKEGGYAALAVIFGMLSALNAYYLHADILDFPETEEVFDYGSGDEDLMRGSYPRLSEREDAEKKSEMVKYNWGAEACKPLLRRNGSESSPQQHSREQISQLIAAFATLSLKDGQQHNLDRQIRIPSSLPRGSSEDEKKRMGGWKEQKSSPSGSSKFWGFNDSDIADIKTSQSGKHGTVLLASSSPFLPQTSGGGLMQRRGRKNHSLVSFFPSASISVSPPARQAPQDVAGSREKRW